LAPINKINLVANKLLESRCIETGPWGAQTTHQQKFSLLQNWTIVESISRLFYLVKICCIASKYEHIDANWITAA
jgi:hypothetical protein